LEKVVYEIDVEKENEIFLKKNWNNLKTLDLSNYANGTYIIAFYGNGKYYYKKIIKQ